MKTDLQIELEKIGTENGWTLKTAFPNTFIWRKPEDRRVTAIFSAGPRSMLWSVYTENGYQGDEDKAERLKALLQDQE